MHEPTPAVSAAPAVAEAPDALEAPEDDRLSWGALWLWGQVAAIFVVFSESLGPTLTAVVPRLVRSVAPAWAAAASPDTWVQVERLGTTGAILVVGAVIAPLYRVVGVLLDGVEIAEESRRRRGSDSDA
jgi:hypothetical protein